MNDLSTFEEIATLLPDDRRERFLTMATRFQTVPQDDEYLQILEAIGFMTLLWKEVPGEVKAVLAGANPISETCESTAAHIRDAVIQAIPSYEDLKQITNRLEAHELALKKTLQQTKKPSKQMKYIIFTLFLWILHTLIHLYEDFQNLADLF